MRDITQIYSSHIDVIQRIKIIWKNSTQSQVVWFEWLFWKYYSVGDENTATARDVSEVNVKKGYEIVHEHK